MNGHVKTRLQASGVEEIKELYKKQLAEINVHIDTLQGMLIALINNDAQLKANYLIIQSVPGILALLEELALSLSVSPVLTYI